ncbi:hypothetical protein D9613_011286 [Agrocybe pediades]|uniref:J domain-containing protein n=1 Tax=Agrocybe pediades TaxID=84607 RepID=A0A8H4QR80_9AGAR|nr:hypothetical protein D9613_011286 [Agrocybe pediades]
MFWYPKTRRLTMLELSTIQSKVDCGFEVDKISVVKPPPSSTVDLWILPIISPKQAGRLLDQPAPALVSAHARSFGAKTISSSLFTVTRSLFCHHAGSGFFDNNRQEEQEASSRRRRLPNDRNSAACRVLRKSFIRLANVAKSSTEYKSQLGKWCDELLTLNGCKDDVDGLVGRGETFLVKEEFEEAVRTFERAFESSVRSDRDIDQRLQRAQKLLKQSKQKDYYKILDVSRDADAKTIKKAYRKQAKKAHPDQGGSEAKMALLNEAYEVLSNPELRQRFDNGEDPMDPMSQQGGHPFANEQHPFAQLFQQAEPGDRGFQVPWWCGH